MLPFLFLTQTDVYSHHCHHCHCRRHIHHHYHYDNDEHNDFDDRGNAAAVHAEEAGVGGKVQQNSCPKIDLALPIKSDMFQTCIFFYQQILPKI